MNSTLKVLTLLAGSVLYVHHFSTDGASSTINLSQVTQYFSLCISILLIWSWIIYPKFFDPLRSLPSPRRQWQDRFYGWIFAEPSPTQLLEWSKNTPNRDMITYTGSFGYSRVVLTSSEAIKEVLVQKSYDFSRPFSTRARLGKSIGRGLLTAEGEVHKIQKKNLLPAFHYRAIKDLYPLFWKKASEFIETLSKEIKEEHPKSENRGPTVTTQIAPWISRAALDIIGIAAWGKDFGTIENSETEFNVKYRKQFQISKSGVMIARLTALLPTWIIDYIPLSSNSRTGARASREKCREAIREKRKAKDISEHRDILSIAMQSGAFDDAALEEQLMTLLAAGHETSALSATFACYLLCKYPQIQERLRNEVRSQLPSPSDGEEVGAEMLDNIQYLKAVTNEVLRLMPAAPQVRRVANKDTVIQGQVIPKGTMIVTTSFISNRLKSSWGPDAEEFNPERWMKPNQETTGGAKSNYDFMSFSQGPRSCIGQGFARGEFLAMLAVLVGRFRMTLSDPDFEPTLFFGVTMRPTEGITMNLELLEGW